MLLAEGKPGPEGSDGGGGSCTMFMDRMGGGGGRAFSEEGGRDEGKNLLFVLRLRRREEAKCSRGASAYYYRKVWEKTVSPKRKQGQDFPLSGAKLRGKKNQQRSFVSSTARKRSVET